MCAAFCRLSSFLLHGQRRPWPAMRHAPHLERNSCTMRSTVDASGTGCCCVMAMLTSPQSPSSWSRCFCAFHEQREARRVSVWRLGESEDAGDFWLLVLGRASEYITSGAPPIGRAPTTSLTLTACSFGTAPPRRRPPKKAHLTAGKWMDGGMDRLKETAGKETVYGQTASVLNASRHACHPHRQVL